MATSTIKSMQETQFNLTYLVSGSSCTSRGFYNPITKKVRLYAQFAKAYSASSPVTMTTPIFNIPEAYRPSSMQTIPMLAIMNGNTPSAYYGEIATDGNITQKSGNACIGVIIATEYSTV